MIGISFTRTAKKIMYKMESKPIVFSSFGSLNAKIARIKKQSRIAPNIDQKRVEKTS